MDIFTLSSVCLYTKMKVKFSLKTEPFCDVNLCCWVSSFCCSDPEVKGTVIFEISGNTCSVTQHHV